LKQPTDRAAGLPRRWPAELLPPARGSLLARALLRLGGWRVRHQGLPALQGVILVYPHTSNWDFVIGILAKWALGLPVRFWGKHSLFMLPLFGRWLRWLGGVAVNRGNSRGLVSDTVQQMRLARERGQRFWLAVAPEGTRSRGPGWRSGAYHVALQAGVPVGLATLDFGSKTVALTDFVELSGDAAQDFALMARHLAGVQGCRPALASPVRLK
jgi:1-acyl-sn-glycerol-3-phosphate acyltransferase